MAQRQIKANNAQAMARTQKAKKLRHVIGRYDDTASDRMTNKSPSRYSQVSIGSNFMARSQVGGSPDIKRMRDALEYQKQ